MKRTRWMAALPIAAILAPALSPTRMAIDNNAGRVRVADFQGWFVANGG
jgi:hypothetical protein